MIKKIFILLFLLLITAYLVVAVTVLNAKPVQQTCKGMELVIKDSINHDAASESSTIFIFLHFSVAMV